MSKDLTHYKLLTKLKTTDVKISRVRKFLEEYCNLKEAYEIHNNKTVLVVYNDKMLNPLYYGGACINTSDADGLGFPEMMPLFSYYKMFDRKFPIIGINEGALLVTLLSGGAIIPCISNHNMPHNITFGYKNQLRCHGGHIQGIDVSNLSTSDYAIYAYAQASNNIYSMYYTNPINDYNFANVKQKPLFDIEIINYFNTDTLAFLPDLGVYQQDSFLQKAANTIITNFLKY